MAPQSPYSRPAAGRDLLLTDAHSFTDWARGSSLVFVPVGALEQHGPHLPLGTDAMLSTAIARGAADAAARQAPGSPWVAPSLSYGYKSQQKSGGGNHLPGTVSLDAATLVQLTRDLTRGLVEQGIAHVVFVNGHYENYQFLFEGVDLALRDLGVHEGDRQSVVLLSYWDYVSDDTLESIYPGGFPGWDVEHGGVLETSLMLHLFPDVPRLDRAVSHPPAQLPRFDRLPIQSRRTPASGCLSAPDGSTADKGALLFTQVTESIADDLVGEFGLA